MKVFQVKVRSMRRMIRLGALDVDALARELGADAADLAVLLVGGAVPPEWAEAIARACEFPIDALFTVSETGAPAMLQTNLRRAVALVQPDLHPPVRR